MPSGSARFYDSRGAGLWLPSHTWWLEPLHVRTSLQCVFASLGRPLPLLMPTNRRGTFNAAGPQRGQRLLARLVDHILVSRGAHVASRLKIDLAAGLLRARGRTGSLALCVASGRTTRELSVQKTGLVELRTKGIAVFAGGHLGSAARRNASPAELYSPALVSRRGAQQRSSSERRRTVNYGASA